MNLLAVMGSPRKGKSTDTLVDRAIEGALSLNPDLNVTKVVLSERYIHPCKNCLVCRDRKTDDAFSPCTIRDDMDHIYAHVLDSDYLIFGSPLHMGYVTSQMMMFLERICWTFAKPTGKALTLRECPEPRSDKQRRSVTILTNAIVPPLYRILCDDAAPLIKQTVKDSLNAKTVGDLYAGNLEKRGVAFYENKAFQLGAKLVV
jgi:hypothetical protein